MARILTVEQVTEKQQVKPLTVREYLREGRIHGRKLGRSWRVVEDDLDLVRIHSYLGAGHQTRSLIFII